MNQAAKYYSDKKESLQIQLKELKKRSALFSVLRLAIFGLMLALFYFAFGTPVFYFSELALIIVFAILLKKHENISQKINKTKIGIDLAEKELAACNQDYSGFDGGKEFINHKHAYSSDLDLFGDQSIFQIFNRTITAIGKVKLFKTLTYKDKLESIQKRQDSIKGLSNEKDLLFDFKVSGWENPLTEDNIKTLSYWNEIDIKTYPLIVNIIGFIAFITTTSLSYFSGLNPLIPVGVIFLNMGLIGRKNNDFQKVYMVLDRQNNALKLVFELIGFIEKSETNSGSIANHKKQLVETKAGEKVKLLNQLFNLLEARLNVVVTTLLNGLFLFDNWTAYRLNKWKKENASNIKDWIEIVGEFDALISLSTLSFNHQEDTCYPNLKLDSDKIIDAKNLQHPLINRNNRIGNDFVVQANNELFLVTGSNMAGKSTFLRAVGINMVLAQTGGVVFGNSMDYRPMNLFTSMRIFDSIQSGASTFFAEVDRIKSILEEAKQGHIFILLDEILKGTNSKDKYTGSKALIEQLAGFYTSGFIATHDLALGSLADSYPNINNRRFEVEIKNSEFIFDYKLKEGVCQTMNATELMKKMGIIV